MFGVYVQVFDLLELINVEPPMLVTHGMPVVIWQSKRIAKEKRIMNWEKLFAKLTVARGHGRRWKFLIHAFKKKADEG